MAETNIFTYIIYQADFTYPFSVRKKIARQHDNHYFENYRNEFKNKIVYSYYPQELRDVINFTTRQEYCPEIRKKAINMIDNKYL